MSAKICPKNCTTIRIVTEFTAGGITLLIVRRLFAQTPNGPKRRVERLATTLSVAFPVVIVIFCLILGHVGLVIVTLGVGFIFIGYRNWSFFIRHLEATGEVELATLTQSTTREPTQGEGLLDAFDVGAF